MDNPIWQLFAIQSGGCGLGKYPHYSRSPHSYIATFPGSPPPPPPPPHVHSRKYFRECTWGGSLGTRLPHSYANHEHREPRNCTRVTRRMRKLESIKPQPFASTCTSPHCRVTVWGSSPLLCVLAVACYDLQSHGLG